MRAISLVIGCIASFCLVTSCPGEVITFSNLSRDRSLGVHVHPTGREDLPILTTGWEVLGATSPFENNPDVSRFYSGSAKFDNPVSGVMFDVLRLNNSGWGNQIKVVGLEHGKRVASTTVDLSPVGDVSQVNLFAPAIDQIVWNGNGYIYHPYFIRDVQLTFASNAVGSPISVGSAVPEPGALAIVCILLAPMLLMRIN